MFHSERVYVMSGGLEVSEEDSMKRVEKSLENEIVAHKKIYEHLGLDYETRTPGTEESYVTKAVHLWWLAKYDGKPEIEEITITNLDEV